MCISHFLLCTVLKSDLTGKYVHSLKGIVVAHEGVSEEVTRRIVYGHKIVDVTK